jgi:cytochrome c oxidase subunit 2
VIVELNAADVIHSFWVPNLHGKKDLLPGQTTTIRLRADRAGTYRGLCAEFCGLQHAWMDYAVVAEPQADFDAWSARQRQDAPEPADEATKRGRDLFLSGSCMLCHAIQGTPGGGRQAPDLTHIASRASLGAGRLANTAENLAAWIRDPQQFKPGVNMPAHPLPDADMNALVAYLETLQ